MAALPSENSTNRLPCRLPLLLIPLTFACFSVSTTPNAFGVEPSRGGGYAHGNIAKDTNVPFSPMTGADSAAIAFDVLESNITGSDNALASWMWRGTGRLNIPRYNHTATLLQNGMVLVTAGEDPREGAIASAELYDPASRRWTFTGSLNTARWSHTATLLQNGMVLVTGGAEIGGMFASAELYDPASGTWTATGSLSTTHSGHTATLLQNGKVLVAGGDGRSAIRPTQSAELYDPASGTWAATNSLHIARRFHTATLLQDGTVLVAAGEDPDFLPSASVELYTPARGTWTAAGSLHTARSLHTATLLQDGSVLVAAGLGPESSNHVLASTELGHLHR